MQVINYSNSNLEHEISEIYDNVLDNLVSDYKDLTNKLGLSHIRDYESDTDDFNIAHDLGYIRAIEVVCKLLENYKIVERKE
jgi:hypothetical protein